MPVILSESDLVRLRGFISYQRRKLCDADHLIKEARLTNDKMYQILVSQDAPQTGRPTVNGTQPH